MFKGVHGAVNGIPHCDPELSGSKGRERAVAAIGSYTLMIKLVGLISLEALMRSTLNWCTNDKAATHVPASDV